MILFPIELGMLTLSRIERYTSITQKEPVLPDEGTSAAEHTVVSLSQAPQAPPSPTSSMKTNLSSAAVTVESYAAPYQPFLAQSARLHPSKSHPDLTLQVNPAAKKDNTRPNSTVTSPRIASLAKEGSWSVDRLRDLHLSGSEPRIFPGVVSRTQRRDSLAKNGVKLKPSDARSERYAQAFEDEDEEEAGGMAEY